MIDNRLPGATPTPSTSDPHHTACTEHTFIDCYLGSGGVKVAVLGALQLPPLLDVNDPTYKVIDVMIKD